MATVLEFDGVAMEPAGQWNFALAGGEVRLLQLPSAELKVQMAELALGELLPIQGVVRLLGTPVADGRPGRVGWIPANGGLISNLKAWENITLPRWYHGRHHAAETEADLALLLEELGMPHDEWERFMASPAARLSLHERQLAGLMRGLLQQPQLLLLDAALLDEVADVQAVTWVAALEKFARAADDRAVLALAHHATALNWKRIELTT